jgi:hypothetical protein
MIACFQAPVTRGDIRPKPDHTPTRRRLGCSDGSGRSRICRRGPCSPATRNRRVEDGGIDRSRRSLRRVAAAAGGDFKIKMDGQAERVSGRRVSGDYFRVLGLTAAAGPADAGRRGAQPTGRGDQLWLLTAAIRWECKRDRYDVHHARRGRQTHHRPDLHHRRRRAARLFRPAHRTRRRGDDSDHDDADDGERYGVAMVRERREAEARCEPRAGTCRRSRPSRGWCARSDRTCSSPGLTPLASNSMTVSSRSGCSPRWPPCHEQ